MYRSLPSFGYFEPVTVNEAVKALDEGGSGSKALAGGVDLVMKMRLRKLTPELVVSLHKIRDLDGISGNGESGLKIGATTTLRTVECSPAIRDYPVLRQGINSISSVQVKTMGTVVGNLCVATPATDVAPPLFVLDAVLKIAGTEGTKEVAVEDLYLDVNKTILAPHEIITEISLPAVVPGSVSAFMKSGKTSASIAKVNVAVLLVISEGRCTKARIALGSVAPTVIRARKAEEALTGEKIDDKLISLAAGLAAGEASPISDFRSTKEYRHLMVKVLVRDALKKAITGRL